MAGHLNWSEANLDVSNIRSYVLEFLNHVKHQIQETVKNENDVNFEKPDPAGHGGTSTTGNVAKTLFNSNSSYLLITHISSDDLRTKY